MAAVGAAALLTGAVGQAAETLTGALVKTYAGNPTIMGERAQLRSLDESVAIARAQGRPQLSGTVGLNQDVISTNTGGGRNFSAGLEVGYPLFTGGRVRNSIRAADERILAGRAALRGTEGDVHEAAAAIWNDPRPFDRP